MNELLPVIAVAAAILGIAFYFKKEWRNASYALFAFAFLALGIEGAVDSQPSALAAFFLSILAIRKIKLGRSH